MEAWATIALVLGSNAIMGVVNWLTTRMQIKNSEKQLEKRLQAQREEYQHRQKWDSRSKPLMELRAEIARMAEKFERIVGYATQVQVRDGVPLESDANLKNLEKAEEDWNEYIDSGEFYRVEHLQYEHELKAEAHRILSDYKLAYFDVLAFWRSEGTEEKVHKAKAAITRNAKRVSALQSRINELLENL